MQRRSFLKAGGAITLAAGFGTDSLLAHVPTHNFDRYDFGSGPPVAERLYQGPFSADYSIVSTKACVSSQSRPDSVPVVPCAFRFFLGAVTLNFSTLSLLLLCVSTALCLPN